MSKLQNIFKKGFRQLKRLSGDHHILLKGSGQSFVIKILSLLIGFGLQVLLARILKVEEFGVYMYVLAWINILTLVGKFGLDQASKKFIPSYAAEKEDSKLGSFIRFASKNVFQISFVLGILVVVFSIIFKDKLGAKLATTFIAGAGLLVINTQLQLIGSFLEALKKIVSGQVPRNIIRPLLIATGIAILALVGSPDATNAMVVNITATLLALIVIFGYLKKHASIKVTPDLRVKDSQWLRVAFPLLLTSGIHLLLTQSDIILLGYLRDTNLAGIYSSVSRISQLVLFGLTAVNIITAPLISELYVKNKLKKLQEMVSFSALLTLILTIPVIIVIALITPFILNIFGKEFIAGSAALRIILVGQCVNAFAGSISFLMTMTKYHKQSLVILSVAAFVNILLNLILIPTFGLEGAAITTAATTVFWNLAMFIYVKKQLKIDASVFGFMRI